MVEALLSSLKRVPIDMHFPDQLWGIPEACDSTEGWVPPRSSGPRRDWRHSGSSAGLPTVMS